MAHGRLSGMKMPTTQTPSHDLASSVQTERTVLAAVGAYLHDECIESAADTAGVTVRRLVTAVAYVLLGGRGDLDAGDSPNYGQLYTPRELKSIVAQIRHEVPLPQIARSVGRTQLGVAWKALTQPEVHALLTRRKPTLDTLGLLWLTLSQFNLQFEGADDVARGRITVGQLITPQVQSYLSGQFTASTATDDVSSDAAEFANAALDGEPLGSIGIWVDVQRLRNRPHWYSLSTTQRIQAEAVCLSGSWAVDGAVSAFTEQHKDAGSAVVYDAVARRFLPRATSSVMQHRLGQAIAEYNQADVFTNVPRAVVRGRVVDEERTGAPYWPEGVPYDPAREGRISKALTAARATLHVKIPVTVVIGGTQARAQRLLQR